MTARKFFYGDTVGIAIDKPLHYGHTAKIDGTLIRVIRDATRKVYYRVACECGSNLTLRASSMDLIGTPTEIPEVSVADMRRQHLLMSLGAPKKGVDSALDTLSERERHILEVRHDLTGDGKPTLRDLAKTLGVSAERVRQIEARAMKKLRASRGK